MAGDSAIKRYTRSGVPVFTAKSENEIVNGGIIFRVGSADEPLHLRGITHLLEHLPEPMAHELMLETNAETTPMFTAFYADGPLDLVCEHMEHICAQLSDLPLELLERERQVLLVESLMEADTPADNYLSTRYGLTGFGLPGQPEFGLHDIDADALNIWRSTWFTTENAAAYLTAVPPRTLNLSLPSGKRVPPPRLTEASHVTTPAMCKSLYGGVDLTWLIRPSPAANIATQQLDIRLRDRLRAQQGVIYSVDYETRWVGPDLEHRVTTIRCEDADVSNVVDTLVRELSEIARNGVTSDELTQSLESARRGRLGWDAEDQVDLAARCLLVDEKYESPSAYVNRLAATASAEVAAAAKEMIDTCIVFVPGEDKPSIRDTTLPLLAKPEPPEIEGREYKSRRKLGRRVDKGSSLSLNDEWLIQTTEDSGTQSVHLSDLYLGVLEPENGVTLIDGLGRYTTVYGDRWADGAELMDKIRSHVPSPTVRSFERITFDEITGLATSMGKEWMVTRLFSWLAYEISETESVELVGRMFREVDSGIRGGRYGLLALTDKRIITVDQTSDPEINHVARSAIVSASADDGNLEVKLADERTETWEINPSERAAEIAAAISSSIVEPDPIEFF